MEITVNSYGAYLHVKDKMFEVILKDPKTKEVKRFPPIAVHKVRTIIMAPGTALSAESIKLALQNNIDIIFIESDGFPLGRVWHSKLGSTTKIRRRQLEATQDMIGVQYTKKWVIDKVSHQLEFIRDLKKHRTQHTSFLEDRMMRVESTMIKIGALDGEKVSIFSDILRGLEGSASRTYFETISYVLPKEYQFEGRTQRPAQDVFNAFLNYTYGILYRRVEKSLIMAGIDPYIGFFHRDDYNQKSMVYDYIEPYRIWADTAVFRLFSAKKINKSHTELLANGVSLTKEAKGLIAEHFIDYLDNQPVRYKNRNMTRGHILQLECHSFANELLLGPKDDFD